MTLLRYGLTTDPFPLRAATAGGPAAVATLTVVASNPAADPDRNPVTVQGLSVSLPVGPNAAELTADASGVQPVAPPGWTLRDTKPSTGAVAYVFEPEAGQGAVGGAGLVFVFNNVTPNAQPGPTTVTIKEGSAGDPTTQLSVTKFPEGWGQVAFWLYPPYVTPGGPTTLYWSGPAGATYTINYYDYAQGEAVTIPGQGQNPLGSSGAYPAQGQPPLTPIQTTVFTLSVRDSVGGVSYSAQQQATLTVESRDLAIVSFKAVPDCVPPHYPVALSWKTRWAVSWQIAPGELSIPVAHPDTTGQQVQPGYTVNPAATTTYYLEVEDADGNQQSTSRLVTVNPAIVNGQQDVPYTGVTGTPGTPGKPGLSGVPDRPPGMGGSGGPGGEGGPGPNLTVNIGQFDGWLLQVDVTPSVGEPATYYVVPSSSPTLTVRSVGGTGGTGGTGGLGGVSIVFGHLIAEVGGPGGSGGPGGEGGVITVNCPASLQAQAQASLAFESVGGAGGPGGKGGAPSVPNLAPAGPNGPDGPQGPPGFVLNIPD